MKHSIRMFVMLVGILLTSSTVPALASAEPLSWTVSTVGNPSVPIRHVSCPSTSLCIATDSNGNVLTSTNPTGGAGAWTGASVASGGYLVGVSCPSTSLCVVGGFAGRFGVFTSTNPTGGTGAWTGTELLTKNTFGGDTYTSTGKVSCSSASLCVSINGGSKLFTSTNPTGGTGAWTIDELDPYSQGISCQSASLCVAVGYGYGGIANNVMTSTNPAGGAGTWTGVKVDDTFLNEVSCPSVSLCVAGDQDGNMVNSTNPTGGAGAWTITHVSDVAAFHGVSCPSVSFCAAVGSEGSVVTSTDPTGGAVAWSEVILGGFLWGVSCPSTSLCIAVGDGGKVAVGTPGTPETPPPVVVEPAPAPPVQPPVVVGSTVVPAAVVKCVVPKLKGKTLKKAKKLLVKAHCKLGKVTRSKTQGKKVIRQKPGPGKILPAGSKVAIKLG